MVRNARNNTLKTKRCWKIFENREFTGFGASGWWWWWGYCNIFGKFSNIASSLRCCSARFGPRIITNLFRHCSLDIREHSPRFCTHTNPGKSRNHVRTDGLKTLWLKHTKTIYEHPRGQCSVAVPSMEPECFLSVGLNWAAAKLCDFIKLKFFLSGLLRLKIKS